MSKQRVDTVRLQNLSRSFINSASFFAAIDLELFTAIHNGQNTIAAFASHRGMTETNAERLMTMCATAGLIEWQEDHYVNAEDVERFLVKGEKSYAGPWLTFTRGDWDKWGELAERLSNPEPPTVIGSYEYMSVEAARRYHEATASVGFGSGRRFVKHVDLTGKKKILDIGGGSGAYSITAVQNHPHLSAIVLDLPPVVEITKEFIEKHDVIDKVGTIAGDFTQTEFPNDCDVAIMASNLPQYSRDIIQQVVRKTFDALLPSGEMHLIGEMLDDDRRGPLDAAVWGLYEVMSNSTGITHSRSDCVGYFESAGFVDVTVNEFIPGILVRVTGKKSE
jgi:ubiquinone/menaquinone biosynthesis C-methylase UbiE